MPRPKRLGLTMRGGRAGADASPADAVPRDLAILVRAALPGTAWVALPNVGAAIADTLLALDLDGIILTGGEDIGADPYRDATEDAILDLCLARRVPVLGICRGLQKIQGWLGGGLVDAGTRHDGGREHRILASNRDAAALLGGDRVQVASYHCRGVAAGGLAAPLVPWAVSEDGLVEMCAHRDAPILAVQWHPERPLPDPGLGLRLLRECWDAA